MQLVYDNMPLPPPRNGASKAHPNTYKHHCDLCREWVTVTVFHPRVRLGPGRRPISGLVCQGCLQHLSDFPVC